MKKINNKGFIATAVLYSLALMIGLILLIILRNTSTMRTIVFEDGNKAKDDFLFYKVIYHPNGGSGNAIENSVFKYNEPVNLSTCTYIKTGYNCNGWSKSINGEMIIEPVRKLTAPSKTITVYAFYKAQSYTLTFDANGGSVSTTSKNVTYDSAYGDLPTPTRTGYTFDGWYTEASGGNKITSSTKVSVTSNQTLYAHWNANKYTIVYNANGGTGSMSNQTVAYDSSCTIQGNAFSRSGYVFLGWTTNANGTDDGYGWTGWSGKWTYLNGQYGISNQQLVLYARWKRNSYTITYVMNGGTNNSSNPSVYNSGETTTLYNPTRSSCTFTGWYLNGTKITSIPSTTTGNITLTATFAHSGSCYRSYTESHSIVQLSEEIKNRPSERLFRFTVKYGYNCGGQHVTGTWVYTRSYLSGSSQMGPISTESKSGQTSGTASCSNHSRLVCGY